MDRTRSTPSLFSLLTLILPISLSLLILYKQPKNFNPITISDYSFEKSIQIPNKRESIIGISERVGDGLLPGPEDLAHDPAGGFIYTGCLDGWIRRVKTAGDAPAAVEDWVHVGGRPLGVALDPHGSVVVAEPDKGLMLVKPTKEVQLLTAEAEGVKFALTDGVDVASDGMIYFTDASYKYNLHDHMLDILEGRPHGRLLSFDPSSNQTVVLVRDLYFANGVSLSPDQQSLIFCETLIRKCKKYHLRGEKQGSVEIFIENLPGFPDNIRYDGEGHYWIALSVGRTKSWDTLIKYSFLRKLTVALGQLISLPMSELERDGGLLSVDLEGKPVSLYSDSSLNLVTCGLKIGEHLYYGSLVKPYISKIDLPKHAADVQS